MAHDRDRIKRLSSLHFKDGRLLQPQLPMQGWNTPAEVELNNDWVETRGEGRLVELNKRRGRLLHDFVQLAEARDAKVKTFIGRYGSLNLCRDHMLPDTHDPECRPKRKRQGNWRLEPIAVYRDLAHLSRALLHLGNYLQVANSEQLGSSSLPNGVRDWWRTVLLAPESTLRESKPRLLGITRSAHGRLMEQVLGRNPRDDTAFLELMLDLLLGITEVRPRFHWAPQQRPRIDIAAGSLFQGIVLSLMYNITGHHGLRLCEYCSAPITRQNVRGRWPKYCGACKEANVPQQLADARRRQKPRQPSPS